MRKLSMVFIIILTVGQVYAHPTYVGYSGAPGSRGTCSMSCHHMHNMTPTVTVTGFPSTYTPGQQYTIAIGHSSGMAIKNFNCSVRIGTGSSNAGTLAAGTNTSTYNNSSETNGIHFTAIDQNSGTFLWTAPTAGTGAVRLYLAALQGNLSSGADTAVVLASNEAVTGVDAGSSLPGSFSLDQNYPNPFNSSTIIKFNLSQPGHVDLIIANILGQQVYEWAGDFAQAGPVVTRWDGKSRNGDDVPSGVYFYQVHTSDGKMTRQMTLLR
jgi:hypothetical protein